MSDGGEEPYIRLNILGGDDMSNIVMAEKW
jgi:hypothetical protein